MKIECVEPVEILHRLIELKPHKEVFEMEDEPELAQISEDLSIEVSKAREMKRHIQQLIKHPLFEYYCLSQQDVMVIADLWEYQLEFPGRSSGWSNICSSAEISRYQVTQSLNYLSSLLERDIICFDEKVSGNYYLNPMILQTAEYTLGKDLSLRILGRDLIKELQLIMKENWLNNEDFLNDLKLVFDFCHNSFAELSGRSTLLEHPILLACLNSLKTKIMAAPDSLGIKSLVQQHGLSEKQLFIMLVTLFHQLYGPEKISEADLVLSLEPNPKNRMPTQKLLKEDAVLISSGLICKEQILRRTQFWSLGVPNKILKTLSYQADGSDFTGSKKLSQYFMKCQTVQTLDDLIIPENDKQLIMQLIGKCKVAKRRDLENWGFKKEKDKLGVIVLLYGAPGTGKTYAAGAIANELQKDLIAFNVPELRSHFYGETEKMVKKAFTEMREMSLDEDNTPIFLLNEADQLIHQRTANTFNCSTIENSIQSIILEEMETFPGILILTTNLESNLDEAFFRRFDLKFRFKLPDIENRRKLWKLYLRKEIPGVADIDVEILAHRYQFSGAQIALVVQNACIEAISRIGKHKRLCLEDLLKYADLEQPWVNKERKSIGF